jgi:hypothetical protein
MFLATSNFISVVLNTLPGVILRPLSVFEEIVLAVSEIIRIFGSSSSPTILHFGNVKINFAIPLNFRIFAN